MKIIGGMFGLEDFRELPEHPLPHLQGKHILLANARSGIRLLVEQLRPATVWMPSYLCGSMIQAVNPTDSRIRYYEVDYDLNIPSLEWLEFVRAGDLVVCIAYFGFPNSEWAGQSSQGAGSLGAGRRFPGLAFSQPRSRRPFSFVLPA